MAKEKAKPSMREMVELARSAEQKLHDATDTAKRLKTKARDAKRKVKQAKKAAKLASKEARAARKDVEDARAVFEKANARADKARSKAAKEQQPLATPKKRAAHKRVARRRHVEPVAPPPNGVNFDESFSDTDLTSLEPQ